MGLCPNLVVSRQPAPQTRRSLHSIAAIAMTRRLTNNTHMSSTACSPVSLYQTCVARAWDFSKPLLLAPAMNTHMWNHPLTAQQLATVHLFAPSTVHIIDPVSKILACGDLGAGAMAEVADIVEAVRAAIARLPPTD